jgi:hypothetical protein
MRPGSEGSDQNTTMQRLAEGKKWQVLQKSSKITPKSTFNI